MFSGTGTAVVTPFKDGRVDYESFGRFLNWQIEGGVECLVVLGTTGESPTVTADEREEMITFAKKTAAGRVPVVIGTGSNSTEHTIALSRQAESLGADGVLVVTPYYNKPTQTGLVRHFSAVADLGLPVILYNVPGRSACEIAVATVAELARHPHVVSVKEAAGSVDRVSRIKDVCDLEVLSGDDSLTLPMMAVGGCGVISVASNVAPKPVADLVHAAAAGRWDEARALHYQYYALFNDVFIETNPIPIKAAVEMAGLGPAIYRLPLCEMAPANREKLRATLQACGVVQ